MPANVISLAEHQRVKMHWDYEARTDAYDQARDLAERDPDAAAYLHAHLASPDATSDPVPLPSSAHAYDPMALYARLAKYYRFSHGEMQDMHFCTFFGYVREASLMSEEDRRPSEGQRPPDLATPPEWSS